MVQFLIYSCSGAISFFIAVEEELKDDDDDTVPPSSSSVVSSHVAEENRKEDLTEKILLYSFLVGKKCSNHKGYRMTLHSYLVAGNKSEKKTRYNLPNVLKATVTRHEIAYFLKFKYQIYSSRL